MEVAPPEVRLNTENSPSDILEMRLILLRG